MTNEPPTQLAAYSGHADGASKASGAARFANDLHVDGAWIGAVARSTQPRARILDVRWDPTRAPRGAVCVRVGDLPGPNGIKLVDDSWPVLAAGEVRHVGEPIALVAGRTREDAAAALEAIDVVYAPLAPVLSPEDPTAETLHALVLTHGDVDQVFADAEVIVDGVYRTGHQEHAYLECQAVTVSWHGTGVSAHGSMQCPFYVRDALAHALALAPHQIRVAPAPVGGGFGGKEDFPSVMAVHAALLSRACGAPVRIAFDRHEDIVGSTKRHPSRVTHRTAVDRNGRLQGMDIEVALDGGAYLTLSSVVLSRAMLHAAGPYRCPHVRVRGVVRRTNTPPNGAFRGFGAPQVAFAIERHLDRIARRLELDPLEIRLRNVLTAGDTLPTGQRLGNDVAARACLEAVAARTDFRRRWKEVETARLTGTDDRSTRRLGLGLSLFFHGAGFTGNGERRMRSEVTARLLEDGRIEVLTAATDMGQGAAVVLPRMAAGAAGLHVRDVRLAPADTSSVPDSGPTVASRTTMIVGPTVARAVTTIRDRVLDWWRSVGDPEALGVHEGLVHSNAAPARSFRDIARRYHAAANPSSVSCQYEPPAWQSFDELTMTGSAYAAHSWGAAVVEAAVDSDTLEVQPIRATVACEVGRVVDPTLCRGQVEGGALQGLGFGLMEEMELADGHYLNDRLATYTIPTFKDAPTFDVLFVEAGNDATPKGVGELPMNGTAPAVVAAIENAVGHAPSTIPATPERLVGGEVS